MLQGKLVGSFGFMQDKGGSLGKNRTAWSLGGWRRLFHCHPIKPRKGVEQFVLLYFPVLLCKTI